ncbi:hypothetical protein HK101_007085, partial [Irineochytrium annulatum]
MVELVVERADRKEGGCVVVINNLGGCSILDLQSITHTLLNLLPQEFNLQILRLITGPLITSLSMNGFSITILTNAEQYLTHIDHPTAAPAWPLVLTPHSLDGVLDAPAPKLGQPKTAASKDIHPACAFLVPSLRALCAAVIQAEPALTQYDLHSGDGDCGLTLRHGCEAILAHLADLPLHDPSAALSALSGIVEEAMGGTSGVLYCIGLDAASASWSSPNASWTSAARAALTAITTYGGARVGDRTMVDAVAPMVEAMELRLPVEEIAE